ncbi:NYN domain-containing protein [Vibrio sonorensis]|uniref:NYN domain-containing protein n=1 Tax=Vibrio sonorensis TaxID=1004316 RepID=UPI0008DA6AEC|nr:NYN domain-containing protein [Vibrio sonorensis]
MRDRKTVAIFVDAGFFTRMFTAKIDPCMKLSPESLAKKMWGYWMCHVNKKAGEELYRIYFYDCPPLMEKSQHPITNKPIDFAKSELSKYKNDLIDALLKRPYVATRMGELSTIDKEWGFKRDSSKKIKKMFRGELLAGEIDPNDIVIKPRQKGVDMKLGIDISCVVLKGFANKIVLISGDSDFVPAAKLARTEGAHFVLDAMGRSVNGALSRHIDGLKTFINRPRYTTEQKEPV